MLDSYILLYYAGLLVVTAVAIVVAILIRKHLHSIVSGIFVLLIVPWFGSGAWAGVLWSDFPSWWDQYFTNSIQWYPLYVTLSVAGAIWGKMTGASRAFMGTVKIIPLLSALPWTCVLMIIVIIFVD